MKFLKYTVKSALTNQDQNSHAKIYKPTVSDDIERGYEFIVVLLLSSIWPMRVLENLLSRYVKVWKHCTYLPESNLYRKLSTTFMKTHKRDETQRRPRMTRTPVRTKQLDVLLCVSSHLVITYYYIKSNIIILVYKH